MNCEQFQENLYDYLDEGLSPTQKTAAQRHLLECGACRAAVKREQQFAQSLSSKLEQTAENVTLDGQSQHRMAAAVQRSIAVPLERSPFPFWRYLLSPYTAAAILAIALITFRIHFANHNPQTEAARAPEVTLSETVPVNVSYSLSSYTFRQEGNLVIDALTCDTRAVNGSLLAKN